jgi:6-pyruvoyltetrahydropterin/6-carboxytetrahydropterin synthase
MSSRASRYHDISCGHRVHNHESKCRHLHGHNYRVHFVCEGDLDDIGRVIDFSVIKERLCMWLETHWDHKFLAWSDDPIMVGLILDATREGKAPSDVSRELVGSITWVPFNPTAENMAEYLVQVVGPNQLMGTGVTLVEVIVEETRKCSASYTLPRSQRL